ncbi:MAG: chromosomal replication initiator protein DnaA, partial [Erysipelotrichaceae bacterium]|nr:chromosomal replication initiator protein DnaA [Erysipelotrichaceae bacterium]
VDDIQFISGKERTQEEFFHTFNTLHEANCQIVLTSDRPPKEIKTLEDRLRSRFESGLLADIQPPDFETRMAIIKRKAELLEMNLPDDVTEYIATRLKTNIRQLEGVVKKLKAKNQLYGEKITINVAQKTISDILNNDQPPPLTVEKIIDEVAHTYGVTGDDIRSAKRNSNISNARQIAIYAVREITGMSMKLIGEEFGGRDHSTIVYAINQIEKNMSKDPKLKSTVEDIIKNIRDR